MHAYYCIHHTANFPGLCAVVFVIMLFLLLLIISFYEMCKNRLVWCGFWHTRSAQHTLTRLRLLATTNIRISEPACLFVCGYDCMRGKSTAIAISARVVLHPLKISTHRESDLEATFCTLFFISSVAFSTASPPFSHFSLQFRRKTRKRNGRSSLGKFENVLDVFRLCAVFIWCVIILMHSYNSLSIQSAFHIFAPATTHLDNVFLFNDTICGCMCCCVLMRACARHPDFFLLSDSLACIIHAATQKVFPVSHNKRYT